MAFFLHQFSNTIAMENKPFETIEELLADESFLAWYGKANEREIIKWNEKLASDSDLKELAMKAVKFLEEINLEDLKIPCEQVEKATMRLMQQIKMKKNDQVEK
jgi:hypothetical protein